MYFAHTTGTSHRQGGVRCPASARWPEGELLCNIRTQVPKESRTSFGPILSLCHHNIKSDRGCPRSSILSIRLSTRVPAGTVSVGCQQVQSQSFLPSFLPTDTVSEGYQQVQYLLSFLLQAPVKESCGLTTLGVETTVSRRQSLLQAHRSYLLKRSVLCMVGRPNVAGQEGALFAVT